jgi:hypothetical protein
LNFKSTMHWMFATSAGCELWAQLASPALFALLNNKKRLDRKPLLRT